MDYSGPKRDEVTGEWRKLLNEELYDLYASPNIIRVIKCRINRCEELLTRMGGKRSAYRVGRYDGKWPLGRPRPKGEDNIKMYIQKVEWGMD